MKNLLSIGILCCFACSVSKHKTENSSWQQQERVQTLSDLDSLQLVQRAGSLQFLRNDRLELTEIVPQGAFYYSPDSGFNGTAARLRIYRNEKAQRWQQDSSATALMAVNKQVFAQQATQTSGQRQLEETKASKTVGWISYLWLAALCAFLATGWVFIRKR